MLPERLRTRGMLLEQIFWRKRRRHSGHSEPPDSERR